MRHSCFETMNNSTIESYEIYNNKSSCRRGIAHKHVSETPFPKSYTAHHFMSAGVRAWTTEVPSMNRVRKMRFAFPNMPSFRLTTMN